jgi:hypothetical protein
VAGNTQALPVALADGLLITGDLGGTLTAAHASTGAQVWRLPRPASCGQSPQVQYDEAVGSDGTALVASYQCATGGTMVRRLTPATGQTLWQWESIHGHAGQFALLTVAGTAGGVVMLSGQVGPPPFTTTFLNSVPRRYQWPSALGPDGAIETEVAVDALTGHARWAELGAQQATLTLADGAACEVANTGVACRDDITGGLTRPIVVTDNSSVPPSGSGYAGITGDRIYVVTAPVQPHRLTIATLTIRGDHPLETTSVAMPTATTDGSRFAPFIQAAATLPYGVLLLTQRLDDPSYPYLALKLNN